MKSPVFNRRFVQVFGALILVAVISFSGGAFAALKLPTVIGDNMVLQRDQDLKIWGWDNAGQEVSVSFGGQTVKGKANDKGRWEVTLKPLKTNAKPQQMVVSGSGGEKITVSNILVGEVWLCSGQSNMSFAVGRSYGGDLDALTANYPNIRMISVPQVGVQEPQDNFKGQWEACEPGVTANFSGVGYYFGRVLHQALGVPIGLIDNAWGGSAAEAWVRRDILEKDAQFEGLMARWVQTEKTFDFDAQMEAFKIKKAAWQAKVKEAKTAGKPVPPAPRPPRNVLTGQHRPGNLYNGVLHPVIGYGMRGAIWYQGESNAGRAYEYRNLFPLMIQNWRDVWGQGDFPFYWVQLADFKGEIQEPADSQWAELREAQTLTMKKLKNTGEAVIIDVGEGRDIHPRNKRTVGERLARWALAKDYGFDKLAHQSPTYQKMEKKDGKILLTFDHVSPVGLYSFDTREPVGFSIAGADKKFVWAKGKIIGKTQVEVWNDAVKDPVAVRYAWSDNPVANMSSMENLPMTPFRTDDFPMITKPAASETSAASE
ncbi:MAG: sialate O-acetylesterase [Verrucomicrobia bacterium]|nr:sialate O-acetylesterase [Verrucomicrobiota bacterium]